MKIVSFVLIGAVIIILTLSMTSPATFTSQDNSEALVTEAYLAKHKQYYSECAQSVGDLSMTNIEWVATTQFITEGADQSFYDAVDALAAQFKELVKEECSEPIAKYEANYKIYSEFQETHAKSRQSFLSRILGQNAPTTSMSEYEPRQAKLLGAPPKSFVYTDEEVVSFITEHL